jgi:hypothetical protein
MTFQNGGRLDTPKKVFFFFYHNFYWSNGLFSEIKYLLGENEVGGTFTESNSMVLGKKKKLLFALADEFNTM